MPTDNFNPFYSEVHQDVQDEIAFRSSVSLATTRTSDQLEWITNRTSWGSITLLEPNGESVRAAINNKSLRIENNPTITGQFRGIQQERKNIENTFNDIKNTVTSPFNNVRSFNATDTDYLAGSLASSRSGRSGPALQSINISLADTSHGAQGLLNEAQVEILVPDIEYFSNTFDSTWFKLGLPAVIEIGHSVRLDRRANFGRFVGRLVNFNFEYEESGMVRVVLYFKATTELFTNISARSKGNLGSDTNSPDNTAGVDSTVIDQINSLLTEYLPGDNTKLYENPQGVVCILPQNFDSQYFNITSYDVTPELDALANGNSDITGIPNSIRTITEAPNGLQLTTSTLEQQYIRDNENLTNKLLKLFKKKTLSEQQISEFTDPYYCFVARIPVDRVISGSLSSTDAQGTQSGLRDYISLGALVKILNTVINKSWTLESSEEKTTKKLGGKGKAKFNPSIISVSPNYSTSLYYDFSTAGTIVSADHTKIILPGSNAFATDTYFVEDQQQDIPTTLSPTAAAAGGIGGGVAAAATSTVSQIPTYRGISQFGRFDTIYTKINGVLDKSETITTENITFYQTINNKPTGIPAHILISVDVIKNIFNEAQLEAENKPSNDKDNDEILVTHLLNRIGGIIRVNTGNAIDLRLVTPPNSFVPDISKDSVNLLAFRDMNVVVNSDDKKSDVFKLPMFTNSLNATTFEFNGINTGDNNSSYYKRIGTVVRKFTIKGQIPNSLKTLSLVLSQFSGQRDKLGPFLKYIDAETPEDRLAIDQEIKDNHQKTKTAYIAAKQKYARIVDYYTAQQGLKVALEELVVYSKPTIKQLNDFTAPIYPLDVDITLDGIYGFRYGDILSIDGLPPRYNSFVFCIVQIKHTLTGQDWTTSIKCFMRPKINQ